MRFLGTACLFLFLAGLAAADHPPLPSAALPHAAAGKALFEGKCQSCHTGGIASNPLDILVGASPQMWELFANYPQNYPAGMISLIKTLTPQQLDDLSVYLAQQDKSWYTLKGRVTSNGAGLAGVKVTMTTDYKMGTNLYFPAQDVLTDNQGNFSLKTWAGRKILTVSKSAYKFTPTQRTKIGLTLDIGGFGTYSQGDIQVTASQGPEGPILAGETFLGQNLLIHKLPQVSQSNPWGLLKKP